VEEPLIEGGERLLLAIVVVSLIFLLGTTCGLLPMDEVLEGLLGDLEEVELGEVMFFN